MNAEILVIGAGASGLMAARELAKQGLKVIVLEARDRIGGRIHTISATELPVMAETGAEFIHGNLKTTLGILNEAGIKYTVSGGKMFRVKKGKIKKDNESIDHWWEVKKQLNDLETDITVDQFINAHFSGEKYDALRKSIIGFVEGYDSGDTKFASTFAFRNEWLNEYGGDQYRIDSGYSSMIQFLADEINKNNGIIFLSQVVKEINWNKGNVIVTTNNNEKYRANKILITIPPSILRTEGVSSIRFIPAIPEKINAAKSLGFGDVIKILLYFKEKFWEEHHLKLHKMGFLFTEESIPTWWTQYPNESGLLTGWLAGPNAAEIKTNSNEQIIDLAITSLANTFQLTEAEIESKLISKKIINWSAEPFTKGAYAYETLESEHARKILTEPVDDTIYFGGEALYSGESMGTVEAALVSGENISIKIIDSLIAIK